ncbi:MAG TPA: hypothetical protein VFF45_00690 [Bacilli bacterium]|jgi:hypothetical protein|nr:hypothetical protein [Bacilli bacterium]
MNGKASLTTTIEIPTEAITLTAAPPDMLSQKNVETVTGIPARVYLEEIRAPGFPLPVMKLGKLRLVERGPFLEYLRTLVRGGSSGIDGPQAATKADAFLAELGYKRVAAPRRRK